MYGRLTAGEAHFTVACHGLNLSLSVDDPTRAGPLRALMPPEPYRRGSGDEFELHRSIDVVTRGGELGVRVGGEDVERASSEADFFDAVERRIDRVVAEESPRHLAIHAGVVGMGPGALLVAGRSRSGKSTLVEALVRGGGRYLSDDLAMIDEDLRVHPYPRPARRRQAGGFERVDLGDLELGDAGALAPLPVHWIVLPEFRPGSRFEPERLAGGAAVLALLAHTVPARRDPQRALARLSRLALSATVWQGARGEATDAAEALHRLLRQSA